jgi:hypothetical protein
MVNQQLSPMQTVYCVPIDESGEEIKEDPVLQLPLDNVFSKEEATNTLLRMLLNFIGIAILIIMTMFGTPYIHKLFIVDMIKNVTWTNSSGYEYSKIERLQLSERIAFVIIFLTGLFMLTGFATNDQFGAMGGIFIITLLFIAFARLQFDKQYKYQNVDQYYQSLLSITGIKLDVNIITYLFKGGVNYLYILIPIYVIELIVTASVYGTKALQPSGSLFIIVWLPWYLASLIGSTYKPIFFNKKK